MLLTVGLLLWMFVHLAATLRLSARTGLIERIGIGAYRGLASALLVLSLVLMVSGWQFMSPAPLVQPPAFLRHITMLLMPAAILFFIAPQLPSNIRHYIRHPQLIGVKVWALAHLLTNGELRSLILFGGLLAWAVITVILINKRDPEWQPPALAGAGKTAVHVLLAILVTGVLMYAHPWFTGRVLM